MAAGVKHEFLKNTTLVTGIGHVTINQHGHVINLPELAKANPSLDVRAALLESVGFLDTNTFPDQPGKLAKVLETVKNLPDDTTTLDELTEHKAIPSNAEYYRVIKTAVDAGAAVNSSGYIEMGILNDLLREKGMPILSGTKRIQITDEGRRMEKSVITK